MENVSLTVRATGPLPKKEPGEESGEYTRHKVLQSAAHKIIRCEHLPSFWTGIELANVATYVKSLLLGLRAEGRHISFVLISPFTTVLLALDNVCRGCLYILFPRMSRVRAAYKASYFQTCLHSSGAVWESRWPSWAVRPNEPSGFRGRKELLNRASALVTTCP